MSRLVSLRGIQVFEAVGRTGSISAAAAELGVSPSAITQQLHGHEKQLKIRLVQRAGRGIELTTLGRLYLQRVSSGMQQLRGARDDVERAQRSNQLIVSALSSLAVAWLGPLVFEWTHRHPKAGLMIDGRDPEPRLDHGEADFRVSYGSRRHQHTRYVELYTDRVIAVASPALLSSRPPMHEPADLLKFPLIAVDWGPEYQAPPTWREWFESVGLPAGRVHINVTFSLQSAAVFAAIAGRGVALAQRSMAANALAGGSLVRVFPMELPLPEPYFLAWSATALEKPSGAGFHSWLQRVARSY